MQTSTATAKRQPRPRKPGISSADSPLDGVLRGDVPESLARSPVFAKVPARERAELDRAILLPAEGPKSIEEIAREFNLAEKYAISPAILRTYARKLDQLVRPTVTSHVMAGVLSCLPKSYRRKLMDGSEVILVSRVLHALDSGQNCLETAELAKLASILTGLARHAARANRPARPKSDHSAEDTPPTQPARLAESVRLVYGLPLPPPPAAPAQPENAPVQAAPSDDLSRAKQDQQGN